MTAIGRPRRTIIWPGNREQYHSTFPIRLVVLWDLTIIRTKVHVLVAVYVQSWGYSQHSPAPKKAVTFYEVLVLPTLAQREKPLPIVLFQNPNVQSRRVSE